MGLHPPQEVSPFLDPGPTTKPNSLAIVQLSRDNLLPIYLQEPKGEHDGYAEGAVVNTRYGSFPHSTLINVPWGSQIRASNVDTGSRGRKRKRPASDEGGGENGNERRDSDAQQSRGVKPAVAASSGFVHVLPPTPELWTTSLPHRTQVVYTPDYSYVLHRLRVRPGARLIEAGAGSGSFTHAAARAVYDGAGGSSTRGNRRGRVFSFEFHEQRYAKMRTELADHGLLDDVVRLTHRDVYRDGFLVDGESPEADAVFLDLPAPWEALPHLARQRPRESRSESLPDVAGEGDKTWVSPLNPKRSVYICTFSPCIEQVTRTVSTMRRLGWVDIEMVEIANRKLQVFRERIGLNIPLEKGANISPANVAEAVGRLAEIEDRFREHGGRPQASTTSAPSASKTAGNDKVSDSDNNNGDTPQGQSMEVDDDGDDDDDNNDGGRAEGSAARGSSATLYRSFLDGRLITRGEPEIKTHTSYLVFAVLPRTWTAEDEEAALRRWPCTVESGRVIGRTDKAARKQERRELLEGRRKTGGPKKEGPAGERG
ncbi:hypothetical protein VTK73DRAFT_2062 [Phialemonium thermophilum]|uniref:tRNA (adenine(58)-N(1))-methyltransferase catalytic subunit TRM61 n=1 Tax=Phialemonium thermophilum TaxID=223376 RepID=A0ABR3X6S7_9PEZI